MSKLNTVATQTHAVTPVKPKEKTTAAKLNDPMISAGMVFHYVHGKDVTNFPEIVEEMQAQRKRLKTQSTEVIEEMLLGQAMALQAVFTRSAARIGDAEQLSNLQAWSNIALKAQNQCRQTLIALAEIKNPPQTAFIKQQNNAITQQVNNCPTQVLEKINPENELLEVPYVSMDDRTAFTTISTHPAMETVGTVNRPKD